MMDRSKRGGDGRPRPGGRESMFVFTPTTRPLSTHAENMGC